MKKLHLLCNAHLDPVWLWNWHEGLAEAISTFRVAAEFCEKEDGFVFNHNEALLYEWVEEHEPELFARIQKLVKENKWVIMGGWYLQPDCVMPSGESFLAQIEIGNEYFMEKFGVKPETALNFDSFGHTRGLVQILAKTGYKNYLHCRPNNNEGDYIWEGFDGSRIIAHNVYLGYGNLKGEAVDKIKKVLSGYLEGKEIGLVLWGIGNHGGGPSKIDLAQVNELIKNSDYEIVHSCPDEYFRELDISKMPVVSTSRVPSMIGCYTTMVRIKQGNRRVENKIAMAEKAMSYASLTSDSAFDYDEIKKAKKALAFCQFHDILPGTCIKAGEEYAIKKQSYGEEIADKLFTKAFFKLCDGQKKAVDGEIPIMVFNPHPYEITDNFVVEFTMGNQNWNDGEFTVATVYDCNGNEVPTQNEDQASSLNLDWVKRVSFTATLAPSSVNRFDCRLKLMKKDELYKGVYNGDSITVKNDRMTVSISKKTGLIELYELDGKKLIENSGKLTVFKDDEDAWAMNVNSFKNYEGEFELMTEEEVNSVCGFECTVPGSVKVIEDGDVRIKIQSFFKYKKNTAIIEYVIPKNGTYFDVNISMVSNESAKMIKYVVDSSFSGKPYGETAFGCEELFSNEDECVYQKWCGITNGSDKLYVINKGTYGGSFTDSSMKISILRTPVYSGHPILDRDIVPHDRYKDHIDIGLREFSFRITAEDDVERIAQVFNEEPFALSFFPSGSGEKKDSVIVIDNPEIILSSMKALSNGKYKLHLHNFSENENDAEIYIKPLGKTVKLHFGKYELKLIEL